MAAHNSIREDCRALEKKKQSFNLLFVLEKITKYVNRSH